MLVEKKAFRRFLSVYIISSLFLLAVGTWLYYQMNYQLILNNNISHMKKEIDVFIKTNLKRHFLHNTNKPEFLGMPISVYKDKKYIGGSFKLTKEELSKESFRKDDKFYYIHKEHKKWGEVYFAIYTDIGESIDDLVRNLLLFFILSTLFITLIAFVLGKIFLKPMRDAIESLEEFITDATHEINTPISNILANIELANELYPLCRDTDELKKIKSSAFRVSKIFKDLSFVKLEHNAPKEIETLRLKIVLDERLEFFQTLIENKNLIIEKEVENITLSMDREDLIRLVDNLLSNAIKYTPAKGLIRIEATQEYFAVINNGEIRNQKKVLKKFVRDNKNEGGFGLGLYIVQKICDTYSFKFLFTSSDLKVNSKIVF